MGLAMLQDQQSLLTQQTMVEDDVGNVREVLQLVGRIGKDDVELLMTTAQVLEDVAADGQSGLIAQLVQEPLDETIVQAVLLDADDAAAPTREQFKRDAARTGKEVQGHGPLVPIDIAVEHIKKILLGKVRGRTGLEGAWHIEMTALVFSCDDSHRIAF